jgi:hypothetical protein
MHLLPPPQAQCHFTCPISSPHAQISITHARYQLHTPVAVRYGRVGSWGCASPIHSQAPAALEQFELTHMHLLHLNPLTGTACTRCCVRRTDLPGASHLHTPEVSFCTTVLHFHTVVLHSVTTKHHHANHMAVWYRLTTVFYHLMAMTNFHTTVLHFHTSTFNFHTAVLHFNTAPTRLCLAQEVPHTRSAGGHGNPMRPFALPSTCLVLETPDCVCKTPVWLSRKPKPALCYIQQQHKRPFIKPNSTLNQHSFMYGPYCAQNPVAPKPVAFFRRHVRLCVWCNSAVCAA